MQDDREITDFLLCSPAVSATWFLLPLGMLVKMARLVQPLRRASAGVSARRQGPFREGPALLSPGSSFLLSSPSLPFLVLFIFILFFFNVDVHLHMFT